MLSNKEKEVTIPFSALKLLFSYPKEKKIICEISIVDLKKSNDPKVIEKIIRETTFEQEDIPKNYLSVKSTKHLRSLLKL